MPFNDSTFQKRKSKTDLIHYEAIFRPSSRRKSTKCFLFVFMPRYIDVYIPIWGGQLTVDYKEIIYHLNLKPFLNFVSLGSLVMVIINLLL